MELNIKDKFYSFRFGIGFMKDIQSRYKETGGNLTVQIPAGFKYQFAGMIDGDITALADILLTANKTEKPRLTAETLYEYLEDESTDIDALVAEVVDFLSKANASKNLTNQILTEVEKNKAAAERYENLKAQN